jgi:hypothetical protein
MACAVPPSLEASVYLPHERREAWRPSTLRAIALAMLLPTSLAVAQTGVVAGTILDAASKRPIVAVRLQVVGDQNLAP